MDREDDFKKGMLDAIDYINLELQKNFSVNDELINWLRKRELIVRNKVGYTEAERSARIDEIRIMMSVIRERDRLALY